MKLYLVPVESQLPTYDNRGPKYFSGWRLPEPDISGIVSSGWAAMDYGFFDYMLIYKADITQGEHDALILNPDVYAWPDDLNQPVTDPAVDVFFDAINVPTNWLTPSTEYIELLRRLAGMFQFNQRYSSIASEAGGGTRSMFEGRDLASRPRDMTPEEEAWLRAAADTFVSGAGSQINRNQTFRTLMRNVSSFWDGLPFYLGGLEF